VHDPLSLSLSLSLIFAFASVSALASKKGLHKCGVTPVRGKPKWSAIIPYTEGEAHTSQKANGKKKQQRKKRK
jgi:hypothetical protein